jgi:hypothetical protein
MLKGQPAVQYPQPMHCSWWKSTMPLENWTMAPGAGQALRQPGSAQCRQPSLRISQLNFPSISVSVNRIRVQDWSERSAGLV